MATSGVSFSCHSLTGVRNYPHLVGGGPGCGSTPCAHTTAPTEGHSLDQNVNRPEAEDLGLESYPVYFVLNLGALKDVTDTLRDRGAVRCWCSY